MTARAIPAVYPAFQARRKQVDDFGDGDNDYVDPDEDYEPPMRRRGRGMGKSADSDGAYPPPRLISSHSLYGSSAYLPSDVQQPLLICLQQQPKPSLHQEAASGRWPSWATKASFTLRVLRTPSAAPSLMTAMAWVSRHLPDLLPPLLTRRLRNLNTSPP
ncbi:hypothetical protein BDQ12DRAFT_324111 [Crucibulum laeve]|uniref:Uncharacterized protein n=1 Tax=Crucibulum laeve TaxID=68775 RepID=A0A5C3LQ54_9AGAR|nr:hypothetical protein BDQ12DRAFT_324111 [Crucibulum laeve]